MEDSSFIDVYHDNELEHDVLIVEDVIQIKSIELLQSQSGNPRSLATVDPGIPVLILNQRTTNLLLQKNPNSSLKMSRDFR